MNNKVDEREKEISCVARDWGDNNTVIKMSLFSE